jgi:hypothetical protein
MIRVRRLTPHSLIGDGDLERGIDGFRTRVHEEHAVTAMSGKRGFEGELECRFVAHLEGRRVVERIDLFV